MKKNNLLIMTACSGSRFCSSKTENTPKQFLDIIGTGRTLLQQTLDRFKNSIETSHMWIITTEAYLDTVRKQLPEIAEDHILVEPCEQNTAASIAYAGIKIREKNPDANLIITPSDQVVLRTGHFSQVVSSCLRYCDLHQSIVSIGVYPSRSETSYGYIHCNPKESNIIKQSLSFVEKPTLFEAKEYLQLETYFWNTGIYFCSLKTLEQAYRKYLPLLSSQIETLSEILSLDEEKSKIKELFRRCQNISLDSGIIEKIRNLKVYLANIGWTDANAPHQDLEDILECN